MTKETSPEVFDICDLDSSDTAEMTVHSDGRPTSWVWTFAGPGHPQAIALSNRLSKARLRRESDQEAARVNGRKWQPEQEDPETVAKRNAEYVADRLIGWSPVKLGGEDYPFSRDNAVKLLMDPKKGALALQALEFLSEQRSFLQRAVP